MEYPAKFFLMAKSAFQNECGITYTAAIYDYKSYYDRYVDKYLMMKKENFTQLGMIFQKLTEQQKRDNPTLFEVYVNYKKLAQDVTVDLLEIDPVYSEKSESLVEFYEPIIMKTAWMPQEAYYEKDRALGISIMSSWPEGSPVPMALEPWASDYAKFMKAMNRRYSYTGTFIFREWNAFLDEYMPTVPDIWPRKPSDNILDYINKFGNSVFMPLGTFLYGSNPSGFKHLQRFNETPKINRCNPSSSSIQHVESNEELKSTLESAFTDDYSEKASWYVVRYINCLCTFLISVLSIYYMVT